MGEEADWRGLEEEEGTLSPPAADEDVPEDAEAERGRPDGAPGRAQSTTSACRRAIGCAGRRAQRGQRARARACARLPA